MGTHLRLTITAHDRSAALAASEAALGALLAANPERKWVSSS